MGSSLASPLPDWLIITIAVITFVGAIITVLVLIQSYLDWRAMRKSYLPEDDKVREMVTADLIGDIIGFLITMALLAAMVISATFPRPLPPTPRLVVVWSIVIAILLTTVERVHGLVRRIRLGLTISPWGKEKRERREEARGRAKGDRISDDEKG